MCYTIDLAHKFFCAGEKIVIITNDKEYKKWKAILQLQIDSETLTRLEAGGVDNWDWYDESLNPDNEPDMDKFEENEKTRISAL
jgi:hypothetical protein